MPDIKAVLNDEIRRLARKEIRLATAPLMEVLKEQKIIISALKKRIDQLEKKSAAKCAADAAAETVACAAEQGDKKLRLNAAGIVRIRTKLKLTQADFARLLGVSTHTVSMWELDKVAPRAKAKAAICALRGMGKRELKKRLAAEADVIEAE